ncbi:MAG TPA: winged helix DNA-binding protein [Allosphingosinicella sp.]|nr:winged helix DNA-binding protein [Allosphingosinicella sp.]
MAHDALAMIEYGGEPAICIVGDSAEAIERMRKSAEAAGCRVAASELTADRSAIASMPGGPALMELGGAIAPETSKVLDWAAGEAETGARRILVSASGALFDLLGGRDWPAPFRWFVDGTEVERLLGIALTARPQAARLRDIGRDDGQPILQQLTEDVSRIAAMLASLTDDEAAALEAGKAKAGNAKDEPGLDAAYVRSIIRARRLRDQFFRGGLFADPAWDMLLDLMAARLEGTRVAVSSLCIAAAVPATTALRWIKALTDRGLFMRTADPQDGRRVYIALSDDTARALTAYLKAAQRIAPNAI